MAKKKKKNYDALAEIELTLSSPGWKILKETLDDYKEMIRDSIISLDLTKEGALKELGRMQDMHINTDNFFSEIEALLYNLKNPEDIK